MPIAIDAGSPALVSAGGGSITSLSTASFTRPDGGLLVAVVYTVSSTTPTLSGGSLAWTKRVSSGVDIWTAPVTGSGSMTVTVGNLSTAAFGGVAAALKVVGVTGQDPTSPIGTTGTGTSSTNNLTATGYTSSAAGSRGFFGAANTTAGAPTSTDTGFGWSVNTGFFDASGIAAYKAANTVAAGTSVAFNADAAGSSTTDWQWAALEIVPEGVARPRISISRAAVHRAASW